MNKREILQSESLLKMFPFEWAEQVPGLYTSEKEILMTFVKIKNMLKRFPSGTVDLYHLVDKNGVGYFKMVQGKMSVSFESPINLALPGCAWGYRSWIRCFLGQREHTKNMLKLDTLLRGYPVTFHIENMNVLYYTYLTHNIINDTLGESQESINTYVKEMIGNELIPCENINPDKFDVFEEQQKYKKMFNWVEKDPGWENNIEHYNLGQEL